MTESPVNTPVEDIDWPAFFNRMAWVSSFSEMTTHVYETGVLVTDYRQYPAYRGDQDDLANANILGLRAMLTWVFREGHFSMGSGDMAFWDGIIDEIVDELAARLGVPYPLPDAEYLIPRRKPPCPRCGSTERLQFVIKGMPPAPPPGFDESRVVFAGCVIDDADPDWICTSCDHGFHIPPVPTGFVFG